MTPYEVAAPARILPNWIMLDQKIPYSIRILATDPIEKYKFDKFKKKGQGKITSNPQIITFVVPSRPKPKKKIRKNGRELPSRSGDGPHVGPEDPHSQKIDANQNIHKEMEKH